MSHNGSNGLLYRYGNKSRRKIESILILLAITSMPLTCDGEEKIIRVDPLGTLIYLISHHRQWPGEFITARVDEVKGN
jgi:hypothetical protein